MTDSRAKNRPERQPLNEYNPLQFKELPGFHLKLVNELPGRVDRHLNAGYTMVLEEEQLNTSTVRAQDAKLSGAVHRLVVNTDPHAACQTAVLMKIPLEFYTEDHKAKMLKLDEEEMSWNPNEMAKKHPEFYAPGKK